MCVYIFGKLPEIIPGYPFEAESSSIVHEYDISYLVTHRIFKGHRV